MISSLSQYTAYSFKMSERRAGVFSCGNSNVDRRVAKICSCLLHIFLRGFDPFIDIIHEKEDLLIIYFWDSLI